VPTMAVTINLKDYTDEYGFEYVIGIGNNSGNNISAQIDAAKGQKVTLVISSMGGSCWAAVQIIDAICRHGNVNADIQGIAFSAAAIIACACKTVQIGTFGMMMIHKSRIFADVFGTMTSDDMQEFAKDTAAQLEVCDRLQAEIFVQKTGLSGDQINQMLTDETWMTGTEAKELGFVDNISDAEPETLATQIYARAFASAPMRLVAMADKHLKSNDTNMSATNEAIVAELKEQKGVLAWIKEQLTGKPTAVAEPEPVATTEPSKEDVLQAENEQLKNELAELKEKGSEEANSVLAEAKQMLEESRRLSVQAKAEVESANKERADMRSNYKPEAREENSFSNESATTQVESKFVKPTKNNK
jgi:ATP-dependent protease ClpP protease subunit